MESTADSEFEDATGNDNNIADNNTVESQTTDVSKSVDGVIIAAKREQEAGSSTGAVGIAHSEQTLASTQSNAKPTKSIGKAPAAAPPTRKKEMQDSVKSQDKNVAPKPHRSSLNIDRQQASKPVVSRPSLGRTTSGNSSSSVGSITSAVKTFRQSSEVSSKSSFSSSSSTATSVRRLAAGVSNVNLNGSRSSSDSLHLRPSIGTQPSSGSKARVTVPQPFNLSTDKRAALHKEPQPVSKTEPFPSGSGGYKPVSSKAGHVPTTLSNPKIPPKPSPRPITAPEPFKLESIRRHEEALAKLKESQKSKEKDEDEKRKFRAHPVMITSYIPPVPSVKPAPATQPQAFTFRSDGRAGRRKDKEGSSGPVSNGGESSSLSSSHIRLSERSNHHDSFPSSSSSSSSRPRHSPSQPSNASKVSEKSENADLVPRRRVVPASSALAGGGKSRAYTSSSLMSHYATPKRPGVKVSGASAFGSGVGSIEREKGGRSSSTGKVPLAGDVSTSSLLNTSQSTNSDSATPLKPVVEKKNEGTE